MTAGSGNCGYGERFGQGFAPNRAQRHDCLPLFLDLDAQISLGRHDALVPEQRLDSEQGHAAVPQRRGERTADVVKPISLVAQAGFPQGRAERVLDIDRPGEFAGAFLAADPLAVLSFPFGPNRSKHVRKAGIGFNLESP